MSVAWIRRFSSLRSPLIRAARKKGLPVTCEVTPHHLYFDETYITDRNRGWMQMNPPLVADRHVVHGYQIVPHISAMPPCLRESIDG